MRFYKLIRQMDGADGILAVPTNTRIFVGARSILPTAQTPYLNVKLRYFAPTYRSMVMMVLIVMLGFTNAHLKAQTSDKPLIFPVTGDPSPSTWLLGQPYGNTTGAYNFGSQWYSAGQGLHFGIDISMPCGTPLVAVGDGEVMFVDNLSFGSGPHNLIIRHTALGITSLYGHLQPPFVVIPGQFVTQGELVAYSGDPDVTCDSRPHLHLEIRSLNYTTAYNPVDYIDVNWHSIGVIGGFGYPLFQVDMDNVRRWLSLDDQPDINFGGARLNNYATTYPPQNNLRPPQNPPLARPLVTDHDASWVTRRIGVDDCCQTQWWHPTDADRLYVLDGVDGQQAGVYEWSAQAGAMQFYAEDAPPAHKSPDGTFAITMQGNSASIRNLNDATTYIVWTNGATPSLNTTNTRLVWVNSALAVPGSQRPATTIYVSNLDGSNVLEVVSTPGAAAQWLDHHRLLVSIPTEVSREVTLYVYDTNDISRYVLGRWTWIRGLSVAPGGGRILFYTTFQANSADNTLWVVTTNPNPQTQKISTWFGSWRWRDGESVYYIPLNPSSDVHSLRLYNIVTGEDLALTTPEQTPFAVMNGEWAVSADGRRIVFQNLTDRQMTLLEYLNT